MTYKPYDELSFQEKVKLWPAWHPLQVKVLLTIVLETGIDFKFVEVVAKAMGWLRMSVADEIGLPIGEDRTVKASLVKYGWVDTNNVEVDNVA